MLRFAFQLFVLLLLVTLFFPDVGHLLVDILTTVLGLFRSAFSQADVASFRPL